MSHFTNDFFFGIFKFISNLGTVNEVSLDAAERWQQSFQEPATPIMEGIVHFHNDLMFFIVIIAVFVTWVLFRCIVLFKKDNDVDLNSLEGRQHTMSVFSNGVYHHTLLEVIWTSIPALILAVIAVPSFALLYSMEEFVEPSLSVKVTGHQWYWCYEYSNCKEPGLAEFIDNKKFESYMIGTSDLVEGQLRLLEVDQRLLLPVKTHVQIYVTAADVLHCWTVPSLGVKLDACPGRLNQVSTYIKRDGVFYGQCSEICGINHGFMPIVVEAVSMKEFVYRKYVNALLSIVEEDPDLDIIESTGSKIVMHDSFDNENKIFDLKNLEDKNYLLELNSITKRN
jgi:cytochrome c oxidase subunit 2